MKKKTPEELEKILLEMESKVDDSKVTSKKGKIKGTPSNIAGKIYRDEFGIRREGSIYTNPNAIIVDHLNKGKHETWNLITIGTSPEKLSERKFVRRAKIRVEFICCYNENPVNDPIQLDIELQDTYIDKNDAQKYGNLQTWFKSAFRESISNISEEECSDWNDKYYPCEGSRKITTILREATENYEGINEEFIRKQIEEYEKQRQQELLKAQKKKEKAEQKKKEKLERELQKAKEKPPIKPEERIIPVTIEEVPTTITIKKELSNINIIQISRLSKSITKLEKQKEEQQSYLNIALGSIERIQESGKLELMLGQIVTRDRFLDEINRTEIKIQKQKEAIEHIKVK